MPSQFNLDSFLGIIKREGLARPNRFEVLITSPNGGIAADSRVSLLCEMSKLPGMALVTKSDKISGPSYQIPLTVEYGGDAIDMTFLVDRDMQVRRYFDDWLHTISNAGYFDINYPASYVRDIYIRQLSEGGPVTAEGATNVSPITYELALINAFPRTIKEMQLNHTSRNETHRLTITFSYRYWERYTSDLLQSEIRHYPEEGSALPGPVYGVGLPATAPTRAPVGAGGAFGGAGATGDL